MAEYRFPRKKDGSGGSPISVLPARPLPVIESDVQVVQGPHDDKGQIKAARNSCRQGTHEIQQLMTKLERALEETSTTASGSVIIDIDVD